MLIQIETIVFNHDPNSAVADALNIRVDAAQPAPGWVRGAASSAAAYALAPAAGRPLTIEATFSFPGTLALPTGAASVMVRAIPADNGALLGAVDATPVAVPAGAGAATVAVQLPLVNAGIWATGIGRYDVAWQWQVQLTPSSPWIDFDQSAHTIYVTLAAPGLPWSQATDAPHQLLWPWTAALDFACQWAQGVKLTGTVAAASGHVAQAIEDAIYSLGDRKGLPMVYQGMAEWVLETGSAPVFSLTPFIQILNGTLPMGKFPTLNCTDCATAVATFANVLGCDLAIRRISPPERAVQFKTNAVVPIGVDPSQAGTEKFAYHDVPVGIAATDAMEHVYDACLMIDRDSNPARRKSADYKLANGLMRGAFAKAQPKHYKYVHRLITRRTVAKCEAGARTMPDLDVSTGPPAISQPDLQLWGEYVSRIAHLAPAPAVDVVMGVNLNPVALPNFLVYERVLNPEHMARLEHLLDASAEFQYVAASNTATSHARDQRLRLSVGFAKTTKRAREALAWLLTESAIRPRAVRHGSGGSGYVGDVAFVVRGNAAFGVRGTAVVRAISIGRDAVGIAPVLNTLTSALSVVG